MDLKELIPTYNKVKEESYQYRFTIFTPVFNCEKSIEKVHQSLINQTYKNFEWLIINDGSTDNSHEIIERLTNTSSLSINYINNPENQHKMGCFIQAISLAKGEFLLTFDGDDECHPNALKIFNEEYLNIPTNLKNKVCAVTGLCEDQFGNRVGDTYPETPYFSNTFKSTTLNNIKGEKWGFTKTDILKGINVNSQIFSKGLIPESIIWNLIAKEGYITKYINKHLRIYHVDIENSLSSTSVDKRSYGSALDSIAGFNWFFNAYHFKTPKYFLKKLYVLLRASKYLPYNLGDYLRAIDSKVIKFLFISLWPFRKLTI
ncbi:glycosyltransferase family 2 protein [Ichthyenterobacterium magnum]|uniref:Glycosyl transferase family 2 n=1 Tax=Ichthyenterobacterium magnum TaxID=1230530 RepID=A0A420DM44_9FLAO|nr:glycosyltransferase family 2 protein [Ichthyenterobacterium magnum]RKE95313.1 glycosyl transferase family 2 [Ichthyenterobacterium magnum]